MRLAAAAADDDAEEDELAVAKPGCAALAELSMLDGWLRSMFKWM